MTYEDWNIDVDVDVDDLTKPAAETLEVDQEEFSIFGHVFKVGESQKNLPSIEVIDTINAIFKDNHKSLSGNNEKGHSAPNDKKSGSGGGSSRPEVNNEAQGANIERHGNAQDNKAPEREAQEITESVMKGPNSLSVTPEEVQNIVRKLQSVKPELLKKSGELHKGESGRLKSDEIQKSQPGENAKEASEGTQKSQPMEKGESGPNSNVQGAESARDRQNPEPDPESDSMEPGESGPVKPEEAPNPDAGPLNSEAVPPETESTTPESIPESPVETESPGPCEEFCSTESFSPKTKACIDEFAKGHVEEAAKQFRDLAPADRAEALRAVNERYKDAGISVACSGTKLEFTRQLRDKGRSSGSEKISIDLANAKAKPETYRSESFGSPLKPCDNFEALYGMNMRIQEANRRQELAGPVDELVRKSNEAVAAVRANDSSKDAKVAAFANALDVLANAAYNKGGSNSDGWQLTCEALGQFCKDKGLNFDVTVDKESKSAFIVLKSADQQTGQTTELKVTFTPDNPNPRPITPVVPPRWKK